MLVGEALMALDRCFRGYTQVAGVTLAPVQQFCTPPVILVGGGVRKGRLEPTRAAIPCTVSRLILRGARGSVHSANQQ